MRPKKIVVLRHAEKPLQDGDQRLAARGVQRAEYLAHYLPDNFGKPDWIYATAASEHSLRPILTILPLWEQTSDAMFDISLKDDEAEVLGHKVVHEGYHDGQNVLICWHHGKIPALLRGIGLAAEDIPEPWPENDFSTVYVITFDGHTPVATKYKQLF